jgi:hypothetical protein
MSDENNGQTPMSPEVEPADVREDLQQDQVTHVGERRDPMAPDHNMSDHMGAVDGETTPVRAPMTGPMDMTEGGEDYDDIIDPRDELTPG